MANQRITDYTTLTGANVAPDDKLEIVDLSANESKRIDHSELLKSFVCNGVYDYNDLTTATTAISITGGAAYLDLTNDGAGANTNKTYKLPHVDDVWDASTNTFDFSGLSLGDTVTIRFDVSVTTTAANQDVYMNMNLGQGGTSYNLEVAHEAYKASGTYQMLFTQSFYMGDANTRDNPAQIQLKSDSNATVKVNGWFIETNLRNPIGVNQT